MRIGVYAIALNEQANVGAWRASIGEVDHVVLVDTGSTDRTVEFAHDFGIRVEHIRIQPWRFDDAWNAALALMPADLDVVVASALDIRFQLNWREQLEREWSGGDGTVLYSWFEAAGLRWRYPFVHSRHGFRYRFPIHELLVADRVSERRIDSELVFTQSGTTRQSAPDHRDRNIAMLRAARAENPEDLRHLHYLGRELMYAGEWGEAIDLLTEHAISIAFDEERAESWIYVGDCQTQVGGDPTDAYAQACDTAPERREPWVKLAEAHRNASRWPQALLAANEALKITGRHWYFNWPYAWGPQPHDEAALASYHLGMREQAIEYGERALALAPDDARLIDNMRWYRDGVQAEVSN